jgi:hypothetical protein
MIQAIDAGLAGASAWDLDDALHSGGRYGEKNLKRWGFWNSFGGQDGYPASDLRLRPWYYSWSVLARSFPAGSQALSAPSTVVPGLRLAAAKIPTAGGYDLSVAIVNDSDRSRSLSISVPSVRRRLTLQRYDYFAGDQPLDASGFPAPAQVMTGLRLSSGLTIRLPSRGLVVLSSIGSRVAGLNGGGVTSIDNLDNWKQVLAHSTRLKLDRGTPTRFNGDRTRVTATGAQYLVYRVPSSFSGFELKAYYTKAAGIRAYGSPDGRAWRSIGLATTNPAPSVGGGGWYLAELFPGARLPPGMSQLKIVLTNTHTELSQVIINSRGA